MTLKAYEVFCRDPDHGAAIEFAEKGWRVRRASNERCDCRFIDRFVRRAKAFDKYAPGPVSIADYLAEGWCWGCAGCGKEMVTADDSPIILGDQLFCNRACIEKAKQDCDRFTHPSWNGLRQTVDLWLAANPLAIAEPRP